MPDNRSLYIAALSCGAERWWERGVVDRAGILGRAGGQRPPPPPPPPTFTENDEFLENFNLKRGLKTGFSSENGGGGVLSEI